LPLKFCGACVGGGEDVADAGSCYFGGCYLLSGCGQAGQDVGTGGDIRRRRGLTRRGAPVGECFGLGGVERGEFDLKRCKGGLEIGEAIQAPLQLGDFGCGFDAGGVDVGERFPA
jgi:hypothetical protein